MPRIKALREDILRPDEVKVLLKRLEHRPMLRCLIAILYGFGCRVSEAISLRRGDVRIVRKSLAIRFPLKKRRPVGGVRPSIERRLAISHYLSSYILDWIAKLPEDPDAWLFPSRKGGHISRVWVWMKLKEIDEKLWPHLFRHSLATLMAEHGASAFDLVSWFGWSSLDTALKYVRLTGPLRTRWSKREF